VIRKVHTYAGLLTLINLLVYALAGFYGAVHGKNLGETRVEYRSFTAAPDETGRQTAERVVALLGLTLATPVLPAAFQQDPSGDLLLDFYHANGRDRVTVLRDRNLLRIESARTSFARYADVLHLTTGVFRSGDRRLQWWAYYNEFALWCFVVMLASSTWLAVRRFRKRKGWWTSLAVTIRSVHLITAMVVFPFAVIVAISSIQLAHRSWFAAAGAIAWANRIHRSSAWVAGTLSAGIVILAGTGVYLWFRNRRERMIGAALAIPAGSLTLALIVSMRAC
jgi:hypothetical protein